MRGQGIEEIRQKLRALACPKRAEVTKRFFKHPEQEVFIGIRVPELRKLATAAWTFEECARLLASRVHEERFLALLCLLKKRLDKEVFDFYLSNTEHINNWDLVDLSAPGIVGKFLLERPKEILTTLAHSPSLWERRIAIVATYHFIKRSHFQETLRLAALLLNDKEDLIHKAVGWMLREVGKRDLASEEEFLHAHRNQMPRTMLRYAIEKFPETKRLYFLN